MKIFLLTSLALIAFAANSLLCRLALVGDQAIDAVSFTVIRLLSGVLLLMVIIGFSAKKTVSRSKGSWRASVCLFIYALAFSFAYITLDTGVGALILFTAVQLSMLLISFVRGERFSVAEWLGLIVAFAGFVYLLMPSLGTPSFLGLLLMSIAGVAWGLYTLMGRGSMDPLGDTGFNFLRSLCFVPLLLIVGFDFSDVNQRGVMFAVASGALASAVGYTLWYSALTGLSAMQAAIVQLLVPIIAAAGGIVFASELMTPRLAVSTLLIVGGILLVILVRQRQPSPTGN